MRSYQYPADCTPAEEGGFVITFPDFPEAITQGETSEQGIEEASDALEEAVIGRINTGEEIPLASDVQRGQFLVPIPAPGRFQGRSIRRD
jgi:antitoxin HicB